MSLAVVVMLPSPVCPSSVLIPPCPFCFLLFLLPLCPTRRRSLHPGPLPSSGLYVCCPPAARDLSSADGASSFLSASPCAAHDHHQREHCALTPAGRDSPADSVNQRGSKYCESAFILTTLLKYSQLLALNCLRRLTIS